MADVYFWKYEILPPEIFIEHVKFDNGDDDEEVEQCKTEMKNAEWVLQVQ